MHKTLVALSFILLLTSCGHELDKGREFTLEKVSYSKLDGWDDDNIRQALPAMLRSCARPTADYKEFCAGLKKNQNASGSKIRSYIEKSLTPYKVISKGKDKGKITGYYEAELNGTRTKTHAGQVPVYGAPKGYRQGQKLASRKKIESTSNYAPIVAWADDPVELFVMQIQGSGVMTTPSGEEIQLGYAGNNGHTFKSLGQIMKENGVRPAGGYSMPAMKKWLQQNPSKGRKLMAQNPRYIFFKENKEGPYGSAGVVLTPKRSVAVDKKFIPMHTPMFLEVRDPDGAKLNRLVMAQDVGNAITGPIRADFFWGHGSDAFHKAGRMNSNGRYYLLLPK